MKVEIKPEAEETLFEIAYFIDCINTDGAGGRWIDRFIEYLYSYTKPNVTYALCNDSELAALGLSCVSFNDWIAAFVIIDDTFVVRKIIRGSFLH
ncbi:MAG: hypothetical protein JST83_16215 [Bacteroidetes bacterium]|nr:hypothetical protein [Bacteroidota bacterium]